MLNKKGSVPQTEYRDFIYNFQQMFPSSKRILLYHIGIQFLIDGEIGGLRELYRQKNT